jgi:glutaredoxin-dependent peroxiredoxin
MKHPGGTMGNNVVHLLNARHATRAMLTDKLSEDAVADLIEAARLTPSCFNKQPWRFLFLESPEALAKGEQFFSKGNWEWASRAPLVVVGYSRAADDCAMKDGREYHQFDLGMAVMNLILAATDHGLVARPMAGFEPARVKELFGLEEPDRPLVVIAIGKKSDDDSHVPEYARGADRKPRARKPAAEIVRRL